MTVNVAVVLLRERKRDRQTDRQKERERERERKGLENEPVIKTKQFKFHSILHWTDLHSREKGRKRNEKAFFVTTIQFHKSRYSMNRMMETVYRKIASTKRLSERTLGMSSRTSASYCCSFLEGRVASSPHVPTSVRRYHNREFGRCLLRSNLCSFGFSIDRQGIGGLVELGFRRRNTHQWRNRLAFSALSSEVEDVEGLTGYCSPPKEINDIVLSPPEPLYSFSPNREMILQLSRPPVLPPVLELARPELKLAGLRIDPEGFCPSRTSYFPGLSLAPYNESLQMPFKEGDCKPITGIPEDSGIGDVAWSPDSSYLGFVIRKLGDRIERPPGKLHVANIDTGISRCVLDVPLNSVLYSFSWIDDRRLIVSCIPEGCYEKRLSKSSKFGPIIEDNTNGFKSQSRTFQDLLKNEADEKLFEQYCTSQLIIVDVVEGTTKKVSKPRMYTSVSPSPDGKFLLVAWLERPFSYVVPAGRFPKRVELWDHRGNFLREIAYLPLALDIPLAFDACRKGPRSIMWRDDKPSEVIWAEAQDGGDPAVQVSPRDIVYSLSAESFDYQPKVLVQTEARFAGITWGHDNLALLYETERKTRRSKCSLFEPIDASKSPRIIFDRNYEDSYSDPGSPVLRRTKLGRYVLAEVDIPYQILLQGSGASPEGNRPFLDLFSLENGSSKRIWQSKPPFHEVASSILRYSPDDGPPGSPISLKGLTMLARRESVETPPQYYTLTFEESTSGEIQYYYKQLSNFDHPYPTLKGLTKKILKYKRKDGVNLTGTLYLPPGYDKDRDGKLPALLWAYPRDFKSREAAGQLRRSEFVFDTIGPSSPLLFLTQGFAVLDGPTFPIVGEGDEEPNDSYNEQLVASAEAAVEELERQGMIDTQKLAIGGHSYGAFMVAGILAHAPDLFACGIARSGAYNRSLTPFGFQSEERTLWQAPDVYFEMSPFNHCHKIKKPLLVIHGEADNNPGTFTMQSERFFAGLRAHGVKSRLVILPWESHSYVAKESVCHVLAETYNWLERYCK